MNYLQKRFSMTIMQVRIDMCRKLPEELQFKIWKDYVTQHVRDEIETFTNPIYVYLELYHKSYDNLKLLVEQFVHEMYLLYTNNAFYLAILIDMIEERVFDSVYNEEMSQLLDMIHKIRTYIRMPTLLVQEIILSSEFSMSKLSSIKENIKILNRMMFPYHHEEE